jgi:hypothetical protein
VQFLCKVASWVVDTQPQLHEIHQELTRAHETKRNFEPWTCGELFCERYVERYSPEESHLQVTVSRHSDKQTRGLEQALSRGDFNEYHRRAALLRNHTKTVTLVGHRPLKLPPDVTARRWAEGDDPDAFKALILKARRQYERQWLSPLKTGHSPKPTLFGHRKFDVPPRASVEEVAMAIGLPLAQEGILADETVKLFLLTAMGVPAPLVDGVWERLKRHFSDAQNPLSLRAYIQRLVREQCRPEGDGVFQDESGTEYWTVERAAQKLQQVCQEGQRRPGALTPRGLKTHAATVYRWITDGVLRAREFSCGSGVRSKVVAVARVDIEGVKTTHTFDEGVIILLGHAHHITRASAERQYRRICHGLNIKKARTLLKSDEEQEAIRAVLKADPQVVHYQEHRKQRRLQ